MADINHVVLVGRLVKDAELKYTASGQAVSKFSLAINRRKKNGDQWEDEVNYFDVVLWGRQGEAVNQYLTKGKLVGVDGELRQDRWQQDGQTRSKVEIIASNVQLLGGNPSSGAYNAGNTGNAGSPGGQSGGGNQGPTGYSQSSRRDENPSPPSDDNFTDDIPF